MRPRRLSSAFLVLAALSALLVAGCELLGPRTLRRGRTAYNASLKTTDLEQLLLNIVRLRFVDKLYFLEIASISSNAEMGATFGGTETKGVEGALGYVEKPNIVYTPLTGEKFVRQLLEPIDLNTLLLLRSAGWEFDDILRVFANGINGIPNAPTGAGPTPSGVPEYREFREVVKLLDYFEDSGDLDLGLSEDGSPDELAIQMRSGDLASVGSRGREGRAAVARAVALLRLDGDRDTYRVRIGLDRGGGEEMVVETRPIMAAMYYLGRGIDVPVDYQRYTRVNRYPDGRPFDWQEVLGDLFHVRNAKRRPRNAYVAARYGGYWYYIDARDIDSKEVLTMLDVVLTLKAGGVPSGGPVLTLPVNR